MKIMISYFYQIRFMPVNCIPISTCYSDPKWFHNMTKDLTYQFKDKRGIWNGLRAEPFVPGPLCEGACRGPEYCETLNAPNCSFLRRYRQQLNQLDFNNIMARFKKLGNAVKTKEGFFEEPILVLIVYETPTNPCSERAVIQNWFHDNGYELEEWHN